MKLPLLLSVPHGGLTVPPEVEDLCILTPDEVREDGDEGAREIYALSEHVESFVTTEIARAIVDQNRPTDDRRPDGVVKTHTCWNVPVYREFPDETAIDGLLDRHYHPYHRALAEQATNPKVRLGVDCHTMAASAPPIGPDVGERPAVCLSNNDETCPDSWIRSLQECFLEAYGGEVRVNDPFRGGFITRSRPGGLPWVQIELSRAPLYPLSEKRTRVLSALSLWVERNSGEKK